MAKPKTPQDVLQALNEISLEVGFLNGSIQRVADALERDASSGDVS